LNRRLCTLGLLLGWIAALSGCAGGPLSGDLPGQADSGAVIGEKASARERARIHTELADAYYQRGNLGVALSEARIAAAADSGYVPAHSMLALVYWGLRENDLAEEAFERSLRLNPNDPDANHNFAWFLCENKREEESIRYFLMAIRHPLYATPQKSYVMAAICAQRKNNERDAHDYLERALRLDPNYYPALISLAQIKFRRGELDAARGLVGRYNKLAEPTAESLWLALRIERRLGEPSAVTSYANQLRRRFPGSKEFQEMQKGRFE
jgi:type IV pilus assembly protein PilF